MVKNRCIYFKEISDIYLHSVDLILYKFESFWKTFFYLSWKVNLHSQFQDGYDVKIFNVFNYVFNYLCQISLNTSKGKIQQP